MGRFPISKQVKCLSLVCVFCIVGMWCYTTSVQSQQKLEKPSTFLKCNSHNRTPAGRTSCLIFNRVPRSGGETLVYLLKALGKVNNFLHEQHLYRTPWNRLLLREEQKSLVRWCEYQNHAQSYDRHFLYVNFTHFAKYKRGHRPIYINLLRDPIEREYSAFLFRRSDPLKVAAVMREHDSQRNGSGKEWYNKDFERCVLTNDPECTPDSHDKSIAFYRAIPYFCGQHTDCLVSNQWSLERAKSNVLEEYSVIGILEDIETTLKVFEHYIPYCFQNATSLYFSEEYGRQHEKQYTRSKNTLSQKTRSKLRKYLSREYEFYDFAKRLLRLQLLALKPSP